MEDGLVQLARALQVMCIIIETHMDVRMQVETRLDILLSGATQAGDLFLNFSLLY